MDGFEAKPAGNRGDALNPLSIVFPAKQWFFAGQGAAKAGKSQSEVSRNWLAQWVRHATKEKPV